MFPPPLWGRAREGGSRESCAGDLANVLDDSGEIRPNIVVRVSQHTIALRFEPRVTPLVARLSRLKIVALAVNLDNELRRVADEVGDVGPHGNLTAKAQAVNMMRLEIAPQQSFGARHCAAKLLRALALAGRYG